MSCRRALTAAAKPASAPADGEASRACRPAGGAYGELMTVITPGASPDSESIRKGREAVEALPGPLQALAGQAVAVHQAGGEYEIHYHGQPIGLSFPDSASAIAASGKVVRLASGDVSDAGDAFQVLEAGPEGGDPDAIIETFVVDGIGALTRVQGQDGYSVHIGPWSQDRALAEADELHAFHATKFSGEA